MHFLAKILINEENLNKKDDQHICYLAEEELDDFYDKAFDWRESDAGRWEDEYPNNVLRASDNLEKIISILSEHITNRNAELSFHLESIKKQSNVNLDSVVNKFINNDDLCDTPYHLSVINSILLNEFGIDNHLLNTETGDATITKELFEEIKQNPENYALVLFDCHW